MSIERAKLAIITARDRVDMVLPVLQALVPDSDVTAMLEDAKADLTEALIDLNVPGLIDLSVPEAEGEWCVYCGCNVSSAECGCTPEENTRGDFHD
jgi:hypothetical protein